MKSSMNKFLIVVGLTVLSSSAFATNYGCRYDDCDEPQPHQQEQEQDQDQSQRQEQEQDQDQNQGQEQESNNFNDNLNHNSNEVSNESHNLNVNYSDSDSRASAEADSSSQSDSSAVAHTGDNRNLNNVGVTTGGASSGSSSNASGGDGGDSFANAHGGDGGDSSSQSSVGDTTATSGDSVSSAAGGDANNTNNNGGNSTGDVTVIDSRSSTYTYEEASARAATVYAEVCVNGGSAQARAGGFAISNQDVVCEHLKMASFMREAYVWELKHGKAVCQDVMAGAAVDSYTHSDTCMSEAALKYYEAYHEHMDDALRAMDAYEEVGLADKIAGALTRPAALIGALIWLL